MTSAAEEALDFGIVDKVLENRAADDSILPTGGKPEGLK